MYSQRSEHWIIKIVAASSVFSALVTYPFSFVLNYLDTHSSHKTGTGLIVKAWK